MRVLGRAAVVAACALTAVLVPEAAFASVAPSDGGDVSRLQGTDALPAVVGDFAVVAVNTGLPTETNPYLAPQLQWAATASAASSGHSRVDVYLASADPGLAAAWWPKSNATHAGKTVHSPYGSCVGKHATRACAWVYGNSIGRDDVHRGVTGTVGTWWIDVEQDNTWSSSTARNRAVVEGMVAGLKAAKKRVGIYALSNQFAEILGTVPASSSITKLPSWVAGAKDEDAALKRCDGASLTKGRLTLVQWVDFTNRVDHDVACGTLTQPKPKVSGTVRTGHALTARVGTWGPDPVHLTYRWTRDGKNIAKATHRTYTLKAADRRHRIGVTVTGTEVGYSKAVQRSTTHRVAS